jgi:hypothetical protein
MSVFESVKAIRQLLAKREMQNAVDSLNQLQNQARDPNVAVQFAKADVIGHLVDIMEDFKMPPIQMPVIIIFMAVSLNQATSAEVGKHGGLNALVDALTSTKEPLVKQHGSGALRNLCTNEANRNIMNTIASAPKKLVDMLGEMVREANQLPVGATIVDNILAVLGLMAKSEETSVKLGQECGVIPIIAQLFNLPLRQEVYKTVLLNALRFVQFLAHWSDEV